MPRSKDQQSRSGVAAVEFAFLAPLLLLLVVAGVDFARVYYHLVIMTTAARTGAIYASNHPDRAADTEAIKAVVLADTEDLSPDPNVISKTYSDPDTGDPMVSVTVQWDFQMLTSYPGIPGTFTLERTVEMRVTPEHPKEPYYYN